MVGGKSTGTLQWGTKESVTCKSGSSFVCYLVSPIKIGIAHLLCLQENYGKPDPANVAKVKALYKELDLQVCTLT